MASSPIIWWQIDGIKVETIIDFIFLGSKITEDGDYSHEIRRSLLLGQKKTKEKKPRQYIKKQRHHFADKDLYSQLWFFK